MTTVINTPGNRNDDGDSGAGWAVAVVILLAVIGVGAYLWISNRDAVTPAATDESPSGQTNINVSLPGTSGNATTTP